MVIMCGGGTPDTTPWFHLWLIGSSHVLVKICGDHEEKFWVWGRSWASDTMVARTTAIYGQ